jgi:tight adherence protein B
VNLPSLVLPSLAWKYLALVCCVAASWVLCFGIASEPDNWVSRNFARYCASIERKLYKMFVFSPGRYVAYGQLAAIFGLCLVMPFAPVAWYVFGFPLSVVALGPELWLSRKLRKRTLQIEQQVDGFLLALANALKSRPSIADAIASVQTVVTGPIRQEVELVVKQMRVGCAIDQALLSMSGRVGSGRLDAAISAVLVGRQVGGNVPEILEATAASMREMSRLEGVVRTKTAEGKAQVWVLAAFPFFLMMGFSWASPGYFDPLSETAAGYACMIIGFALWAASIVAARKILRVDI